MKKKISRQDKKIKEFVNDYYTMNPKYRTKGMLTQMMTSFIDKEKERIWEEINKPSSYKFKTNELVKMIPAHFIKKVLKIK